MSSSNTSPDEPSTADDRSEDDSPLLSVRDLTTTFATENGARRAVDGVSFTVDAGETVCLVGESGSGKTVATESITRLIDQPPGTIRGDLRFNGTDLLALSQPELRSIRGAEIAHIFQNPQESMNPCYTVGWQLVEAMQVHEELSEPQARRRAVELLDRVGIDSASSRFSDYPHEFSGGQKQRVMIAMALVGSPQLLLADEPTTALDVTVQAQILDVLAELQAETGMGILFVTHDLGVVAEIADRVVVMYAGKIMERGSVEDVFRRPSHPYTRALLACLPAYGGTDGGIPGSLPDPTEPPDGCRFADRCEHAVSACRTGDQPQAVDLSDGHRVSCVHYQSGYDPQTVREDGTIQREETDD